MVPFYIIKTEFFDSNVDEYNDISSIQIVDNFMDSQPQTKFKINTENILSGFNSYSLETESIAKIKGRAYGNIDPFLSFIKINSSEMYYNFNEKILILSTSKDDLNVFKKSFNKPVHNSVIKITENEIDFKKVISSGLSNGVQRVWFGKINDTRLRNEALYGNELQSSDRYNELIDEGAEVTNITISISYRSNLYDVMITKNCGVVLNSIKDFLTLKERLDFVMYIYKHILKPSIKGNP